jgi:hypothetical protein
MMCKKTALAVAGTIFGLVALAHAARIYYKTDIMIGGHAITMDASYVALAISAVLSIWMFIASCGRSS